MDGRPRDAPVPACLSRASGHAVVTSPAHDPRQNNKQTAQTKLTTNIQQNNNTEEQRSTRMTRSKTPCSGGWAGGPAGRRAGCGRCVWWQVIQPAIYRKHTQEQQNKCMVAGDHQSHRPTCHCELSRLLRALAVHLWDIGHALSKV